MNSYHKKTDKPVTPIDHSYLQLGLSIGVLF